MKKLLIAATALSGFLALTGAAMAADPVIIDDTYDWSGVYLGAQGGYGWGEVDVEDIVGFGDNIDVDGVWGGVYAGYNFQLDQIVLGIEADINAADIDGIERDVAVVDNDLLADVDWFGSVRGRLGFAWDRLLIYAQGGVAFTEVEHTQNSFLGTTGSDDSSYTGYVVGGGLDYAATDNIIVRVDYRYYDFGEKDWSAAGFTDRDVDADMHAVSLGVAWKF